MTIFPEIKSKEETTAQWNAESKFEGRGPPAKSPKKKKNEKNTLELKIIQKWSFFFKIKLKILHHELK